MDHSIFPIEIIIKIATYLTSQDNYYAHTFRSLCKYTHKNYTLLELYKQEYWDARIIVRLI